jgi:phospholipid/cholesterol/gamma-HCH transport system substrate-binding protein
MSERSIEFKVGLLVLSAIVVASVLIFVLGGFSFSSGYTFYVDYNFSGNIKPGAPVKLSGIKVGKVKQVELQEGKIDEKTGQRVMVQLKVWVEDRVQDRIRQDAEFFINTSGVLGEQYLEIVPGSDYENPPLQAGTVARGVDPPRTDLIISRLYVVLDSLSRVLTDERDHIRDLLVDGAGTFREINTLLSSNREEVGKLIASTNDLAGQASITLDKLNKHLDPAEIGRTLKSANRLMDTAEGSLRELTPGAKTLVKDATRVTGLITDKRIDHALSVADQAVAVTGKASTLVDNVNGMVTDIRAGKGTAGALLVREEIYADLREMLRDLKKNPWKFFWKE